MYEDHINLTKKLIKRIKSSSGLRPVILHCDFVGIYKILRSNLRGYKLDKEIIAKEIIYTLKENIDAHTFLIPTFDYNFIRKRIFDLNNDLSNTGIISNIVCKSDKINRTLTPLINFTNIGKKKLPDKIINSEVAYGHRSLFEWFLAQNGTICFWGCSMSKVNTFSHHIENICNVPYMVNKNFPGRVIDIKGIIHEFNFKYYCRPKSLLNKIEWPNQGEIELIEKKALKYFSSIGLQLYESANYAEIISQKFEKDPFFMISKDSKKHFINYSRNKLIEV
tara:strand:- start:731 stop:1567 length:837 start_codon:yes stop_codon:yes gene_type:complete